MDNLLLLDDGKLVWERPVENHEWEVIINGQQRTLAVDCRVSRDQQCESFRLYVTISAPMFGPTKERMMRENNQVIKKPNRWKISCRTLHSERVGVTRFVGSPVIPIIKYWGQPFDPRDDFAFEHKPFQPMGKLTGPQKASLRLHNELPVDMLLQWPGIFHHTHVYGTDFRESRATIKHEFTHWLRNGTKGNIYPFSDRKSTFECEDDEWAYMTDFHPALDTEGQSD